MQEVARGLLLGVVAGFLLFYSVRTDVPYPKWIIRAYDEPIVRILLFTMIFILAHWDQTLAVLFTLVLMFLHTDLAVLSCKKSSEVVLKKEGFSVPKSDFGAPVAVEFEKQLVEGNVIDHPFYPLTDPIEKMPLGGPALISDE